MIKAVASNVLQVLCRAVENQRARELPDQDLLQQFVVRDSLTRPAFQYLIHTVTLLAAKPVIREICVVNHLPDDRNSWIADVKLFGEGFKRAVIAAMSEPFFVKHVEWHAAGRHTVLRCKGKPRFGVDKVSD